MAPGYEWLDSNRLGAYASSTIIGMNTRREHGLLVVPHGNTGKKAVILSKFEESVFVDNHLYDISTNQYRDITFPEGYKYQKKFELNPFPRFIYQVEDRILQKTLFILENRNILILRYELKNQGRPVKIILKPFLSHRYNNVLADDLQGFNTDTYLGQHFVRWAPKANMPELNVYFNRGEFISATLWYHNFYYPKDISRYGFGTEDLFNPGFFQATLRPYETFDLFLSPTEVDDMSLDYEMLYNRESLTRGFCLDSDFKKPSIEYYRSKVKRLILDQTDKTIVPSSNFVTSTQMRDLLISVPGLFFTEGRLELFKKLYKKLLNEVREGLLPVNYPEYHEKYYGAADLSLVLINLGYRYWELTKDSDFIESDALAVFQSILDQYEKGASFNIYCDKDGLIFCGDHRTSLSAVPLKTAEGDVLRYGKLIEINALWYNSVRIVEFFTNKFDKKKVSEKYKKLAEKAAASFNEIFLNESKFSFYDFVLNEKKNEDFRFVQIVPLILPFTPVSDSFAKHVLMRIDEELLTPYGLRSQSKYDPAYKQSDEVLINRKTADFYCGSIWPWTTSFYIQACLRYRKNKENLEDELHTYFAPIEELTKEGLLGYIPEAIHMNHHIIQFGIEDFMPSLANILSADFMLNSGKKGR